MNPVEVVAKALCPDNTWAFTWYDVEPEEVARICVRALREAGYLLTDSGVHKQKD